MVVETKSPASTYVIVAGWLNPENAYVSDDARASCDVSEAQQGYNAYGFNIPSNATITKLEMGLEGYVTVAGESIWICCSGNGGVTWGSEQPHTLSSEELRWYNELLDSAWTPDKLSDANFRIRIRFVYSVSCYPKNTVLIVWNEATKKHELKDPTEVKVGDKALAWSLKKGFFYTIITAIQEHIGTWKMLDLYSGESEYVYRNGIYRWKKHLIVTENHPIWSPQHFRRIPASQFKVGDYLSHLHKGKLMVVPITEIKTYEYTGSVYNYHKEDPDCHLFMKSLSDDELNLLAEKRLKWKAIGSFDAIVMDIKEGTGYVDHLPVRVTYTTTFVRKWVENLSVIHDVFSFVYTPTVKAFLRTFRENLSVIRDKFSFAFTPAVVPVLIRQFKENLSAISERISRVATYKRTFRQEIIVRDAFLRVQSFLRKLVQDLSTLKAVFSRRINYVRTFPQTAIVSDAFRRATTFPRRLIQDLSVLSARLVRKVAYSRKLIQSLSAITDIFQRRTEHFRKLIQTILIETVFTRRLAYVRKQTEVIIIEVKSIIEKIKKWLAWLTKRMRLSLEKTKQPPQAEFKT